MPQPSFASPLFENNPITAAKFKHLAYHFYLTTGITLASEKEKKIQSSKFTLTCQNNVFLIQTDQINLNFRP